jgi:RNA polymerase sigma factor (TIGR02999 family)
LGPKEGEGGGDAARATFEDRDHFLGAAAIAMRRILVNHALARRAEKRGGDRQRVTLFEAASVFEEHADDLAALDEALRELERADPRKSRVVELRFFGGLSEETIARLLGVSARTVEREWRFAKAWLRRAVESG